MNQNVFYIIIICVVQGVFDSLWQNSILINYIEMMMQEPKYVGVVEAVQGASVLLIGLPVGYLSDRYSKSKIVHIGGIVTFLNVIFTSLLVIWIGNDHKNGLNDQSLDIKFYLLLVVMALWGGVSGLINGPVMALFANSTPQGERSKFYAYLYVAYIGSCAIGPFTNIVLFYVWGNNWDMQQLEKVTLFSMIIGMIMPFPMFFVKDKYALQENEEEKDHVQVNYKKRHQVPYLIFINSLISALGSGMSIKFFPLFYKENCLMTPQEVQLLYGLQPIFMCIMAVSMQRVSTLIGRCKTMMINVLISSILMGILYFYVNDLAKNVLMVFIFMIVRGSISNCNYPLGFWKSLESISSFGWSGSAYFGGIISSQADYSKTFLATAIMQACGLPIIFYLNIIVPQNEEKETTQIQETLLNNQQIIIKQDDISVRTSFSSQNKY